MALDAVYQVGYVIAGGETLYVARSSCGSVFIFAPNRVVRC